MGNVGRYRLYKLYSCIAYASPMAVLFGLNSQTYLADTTGGKSIGFWGIVMLVFLILAFKNIIKDLITKNTILSVSLLMLTLSFAMRFIANQLMIISACSIGGSILLAIVEPVADYYYSVAYTQVSEDMRVKTNLPKVPHKEAWKRAYGYGFMR